MGSALNIVRTPELCLGCRTCELACSFHHKGVFDHVVITGKADRPVYLRICDGKAEIGDASGILGKTTYETEEILQRELEDDRTEIAAIRPAGKNLARGDCCQTA